MSHISDSKTPVAAPQTQSSWQEYVEDFQRAGHETVDWIAHYLSHLSDYPALAQVKPGELFDALPGSGPVQGESFETILRDFDRLVMPAVTQWNHPRFFAYFACTGSTPAILGEMLAAALNTNGLHWKTSPAVAELEQVTLDWLRQWMGLQEGWFGIVYDTASVSSLHAIACAREMVAPEARVQGSQPNLTLYTSEQSHSSIEKDAIAVGIGQSNVRKVPVDSKFAMRADALAAPFSHTRASVDKRCCVGSAERRAGSASIDRVPRIA